MRHDAELTTEALRYLHLALHCLKGVNHERIRQSICQSALKLLILKVDRLLGTLQ